MSKELRQQIATLLSDTVGGIESGDEEKIINNAYKRLSSKKDINEEKIIDAVIAAFKDDEEDVYFQENPYEDDLLDLLRVSSYSDDVIYGALSGFEKEASSEYDYHRGAEGSYYSENGKDYRPPKPKDKKKMDEFEIKDGVHDDLIYHNDATKTENIHRTRADMLSRSASKNKK